jgi:hypothetical protein
MIRRDTVHRVRRRPPARPHRGPCSTGGRGGTRRRRGGAARAVAVGAPTDWDPEVGEALPLARPSPPPASRRGRRNAVAAVVDVPEDAGVYTRWRAGWAATCTAGGMASHGRGRAPETSEVAWSLHPRPTSARRSASSHQRLRRAPSSRGGVPWRRGEPAGGWRTDLSPASSAEVPGGREVLDREDLLAPGAPAVVLLTVGARRQDRRADATAVVPVEVVHHVLA